MIAQIAVEPAWFGVGLTALGIGGIPALVALIRIRRDVDNHSTRIEALEDDREAIAALRNDMAAVKTDMQWVRRALERKP